MERFKRDRAHNQALKRQLWKLVDGPLAASTPFHGGNTGSIPVGRAKEIY